MSQTQESSIPLPPNFDLPLTTMATDRRTPLYLQIVKWIGENDFSPAFADGSAVRSVTFNMTQATINDLIKSAETYGIEFFEPEASMKPPETLDMYFNTPSISAYFQVPTRCGHVIHVHAHPHTSETIPVMA